MGIIQHCIAQAQGCALGVPAPVQYLEMSWPLWPVAHAASLLAGASAVHYPLQTGRLEVNEFVIRQHPPSYLLPSTNFMKLLSLSGELSNGCTIAPSSQCCLWVLFLIFLPLLAQLWSSWTSPKTQLEKLPPPSIPSTHLRGVPAPVQYLK